MLRSRHDIFTEYCQNLIKKRQYFDPIFNKINNENNFREVEYNELKHILDNDKGDDEYIHLNTFNKVFEDSNLFIYNIDNYSKCSNIKINASNASINNKIINIHLNNDINDNDNIFLIKNIKIDKSMHQYISKIELLSHGRIIATIPHYILSYKDYIFVKHGIIFRSSYNELTIRIKLNDNDESLNLDNILSYDVYSLYKYELKDVYYEILESYLHSKLKYNQDLNMYQIMNQSYSYMDDIYIYDPEHKINKCKLYVSNICGIYKYSINMNLKYYNDYTIVSFIKKEENKEDDIGINMFYLNLSPLHTNVSQKSFYLSFNDNNDICNTYEIDIRIISIVQSSTYYVMSHIYGN